MQECEQSQRIEAPADEVFAWLSDVGNLPGYLPPVTDASIEGPSAGGSPGRRIRTTLEYPGEEGGTFDAEGYLGFGERSVEPEMREQAPEDRDPLAEGISATLESIRRQIEEGAGKVDPLPPPAGTEPQTGENTPPWSTRTARRVAGGAFRPYSGSAARTPARR